MTKTITNPVETENGIKGSYASVNGLRLYHEVSGIGKPLILLHGGVGASEMFGPVIPNLAKNRQVIAVHLQGHGRTADIDRPLSFEMMSDDIAELIELLNFEKADVLGYSLGGGVALQTAIRRPDMIRKLILISTPFKRNGFYPEVLRDMGQMGPEAAKYMKESTLSQLYPDANWAELFAKLGNLLRQDYDWSKGVAAIEAPVMITYADVDAVHIEHIMEFFKLLGGGQRDAGMDGSGRPTGQLAILPGMTHYNILNFPDLATILSAFLDLPLPEER
ncbi:MAG: alpha/beta fold hydrolase [Flavisolibacter sp.]